MKKLVLTLTLIFSVNSLFIIPMHAYSFKTAKLHAKIAAGIGCGIMARKFFLRDNIAILQDKIAIDSFLFLAREKLNNNQVKIIKEVNNDIFNRQHGYKNVCGLLSVILSFMFLKSAYDDITHEPH